MRVRCSRGLRVSTFHGPMFVRSTDLLALPQVKRGMLAGSLRSWTKHLFCLSLCWCGSTAKCSRTNCASSVATYLQTGW